MELKTVKGKSITFERTADDKGEIHRHQIEGLKSWSQYKNTVCGLIIEFRELEKTVFINIVDFSHFIELISKKSFNFNDISEFNIPHVIIEQKKARTRYTYDVDGFLSAMKC